MNAAAGLFKCHGCGAVADASLRLPFRCPKAKSDDDIDHVLQPLMPKEASGFDGGRLMAGSDNPFLRYRHFLSPYQLARRLGVPDGQWEDLVARLDEALERVDGRGFRITPMAAAPKLARAVGAVGQLWVKDETGNVGGSHKARHLMGVMLYLQVIRAARLPLADGLSARRLAIASCGNAALAAAVIARAADWPIEVFIPVDASAGVRARLTALGAIVTVCERRDGESGDPCFLRFCEAVNEGSLPFGVQGTENGLAVEGGRTLALEMAEAASAAHATIETLYVQVGGGALASALAQGFLLARDLGLVSAVPRLMAVQTASCAPLQRAWLRMAEVGIDEAVRQRSRVMWAWETAPESVAHGILDDETYDWWEIVKAMRVSGGGPLVVDEETLLRAHRDGRKFTGINASATGTAGLAGVIVAPPMGGDAALVFSGVERELAIRP